MKVHPSALKHGVSVEDATQAAYWSQWIEPLEDEEWPHRELRLGFDTQVHGLAREPAQQSRRGVDLPARSGGVEPREVPVIPGVIGHHLAGLGGPAHQVGVGLRVLTKHEQGRGHLGGRQLVEQLGGVGPGPVVVRQRHALATRAVDCGVAARRGGTGRGRVGRAGASDGRGRPAGRGRVGRREAAGVRASGGQFGDDLAAAGGEVRRQGGRRR